MSSEWAYVVRVAPRASASTPMSKGTMADSKPASSTVAAAASAISWASRCTWAKRRSYFFSPSTITEPKPVHAGILSIPLPRMRLITLSLGVMLMLSTPFLCLDCLSPPMILQVLTQVATPEAVSLFAFQHIHYIRKQPMYWCFLILRESPSLHVPHH